MSNFLLNPNLSNHELKEVIKILRGKIIEMSHKAKAPHLGSSLSCIDILAVLYSQILSINPNNYLNPNRDRFIFSKGHASSALYATLAYRGFFPVTLLNDYVKNGSNLSEHPSPSCVPGIEAATGSLGHGLPIGLGMALAAKVQQNNYKVYILMSDGECNEGTVWEAAMLASSKRLDNIVVIIDYNKWQATGRSKEIMGLEPFKQKWESFGWEGVEIDGHNLDAIKNSLKNCQNKNKPVVIIAHTIKGKGVSFMEDDNNWHYRIPSKNEVNQSKKELGLQ